MTPNPPLRDIGMPQQVRALQLGIAARWRDPGPADAPLKSSSSAGRRVRLRLEERGGTALLRPYWTEVGGGCVLWVGGAGGAGVGGED